MKKRWQKAAILAAAASGLLAAILAFHANPIFAAMGDQLETIGESTDLTQSSLPILVARGIRVFLGVLGIICVVLMLYVGFLYLTSKGDPKTIEKAKAIFRNTVIGLAIILTSFAITTFILNMLLDAAGLGGSVTSTTSRYSEPLSASLGAGIIESHYPARDALDIPRNTRIMVTFKEAINPASIAADYDTAIVADPTVAVFGLNVENVLIYKTSDVSEDLGVEAADVALESDDVMVSMTADHQTFVFDPVDYLGSATEDTNYTILLGSGIEKADGDDAFVGSESDGYEWSFEVSTEIDLTPPYVVSVVPLHGTVGEARNVVIQATFSEAMDPVAASGTFGSGSAFTNFSVLVEEENVEGATSITNQYQTVEFLPVEACGEDPCGDTIYCLPGEASVGVEARAATISTTEPPQGVSVDGLFDGLVDAAGNTLDGDGDWGEVGGEAGDDLVWSFTTSDEINDDPPVIIATVPSLTDREEIGVNDDVEIIFNMAMRAASLNTDNVRLETDYDSANPSETYQRLWYSNSSETLSDLGNTKATISHGTMWESVENPDGTTTLYYYYPVITQEVESAYQICMFPSYGPADPSALSPYPQCVSSTLPYCCNGSPSSIPCKTQKSLKSLGQ